MWCLAQYQLSYLPRCLRPSWRASCNDGSSLMCEPVCGACAVGVGGGTRWVWVCGLLQVMGQAKPLVGFLNELISAPASRSGESPA